MNTKMQLFNTHTRQLKLTKTITNYKKDPIEQPTK